ncbi:MAG: arginine repressor [Clostridia bacterium]|nr:arginine repressor [Clostridia bacterium]
MKNKRQEKIIEIIESQAVETQEALQEKLRECGFDVTQATVSRDIKELRLTKVAAKGNRYKYAVLDSDDPKQAAKFIFIMKETVLSVQTAQNMLVIKTFSGMAQAAAAALDNLFGNEVIGTIAGDDTIFAVTASNADAEALQDKITAELNLSK